MNNEIENLKEIEEVREEMHHWLHQMMIRENRIKEAMVVIHAWLEDTSRKELSEQYAHAADTLDMVAVILSGKKDGK